MTLASQPAMRPPEGQSEDSSPPPSLQLLDLSEQIENLYRITDAVKFGLSVQEFRCILAEIADEYVGTGEGQKKDVRDLLGFLRVQDLVLARACAAGNEKAWETFLIRYRESLYDMACSIAHDDSVGRELADSLYGDLYGLTKRGEQRPSKLLYYTGIGSLAGWLRTVLAQSFIDRYRTEQKLVNLEEEEESHPLPEVVVMPAVEEAVDPRVIPAIDDAFGQLSAEERLIISSYYLDGQTLAEIAAMLGVHESTVSRRLDKIIASLHKKIRILLLQRGMNAAAVQDVFRTDVRDLNVNIAGRLKQNTQE